MPETLRCTAITLLLAAVAGCGSSAALEASQRDVKKLQRELAAERAQVAKLKGKVGHLQGEMTAVRDRLLPFEQRAGLKAFEGGTLARGNRASLEKKAGIVVHSPGKRPKKQALASHLGQYRGAVIGFWATWCKPCIADEELKHMRDLQAQLRPFHVDFVSVLVDDLGKAQSHPKAKRWLYPLWFIKDGHMNMLPRAIMQRVGLGLPFFLVVDHQAKVHWFHKGKLNDANVRDLITAAARL